MTEIGVAHDSDTFSRMTPNGRAGRLPLVSDQPSVAQVSGTEWRLSGTEWRLSSRESVAY